MGSEWACPVFSDSEEGIISGLFGFKVSWGLVVKTGVESGAVVEGFDVMEDGATRFGQGGEAVVVNQFVFEAAKERFEGPKWGQGLLLLTLRANGRRRTRRWPSAWCVRR